MTRLRIASLFVAVVAGAYAALMLIVGQPIRFRHRRRHLCGILGRGRADRLRRQATPQGGGAGTSGRWEGRDPQAATAADQQCPFFGGARQKLSDSPRFVARKGARHARRPSTQSRHDEPAAGLTASSDG